MRPELQNRFLRVAHSLERLEQIKSIVEDVNGTSSRGLIASAAIAGAEFLASAHGYKDDVSLVHRVYEEVFAALENSEALNELLSQKTASVIDASAALAQLQKFRLSLIGDNNE